MFLIPVPLLEAPWIYLGHNLGTFTAGRYTEPVIWYGFEWIPVSGRLDFDMFICSKSLRANISL
jgi:hypothetical protein